MIETRYLEYFLAVVREQSITRAAQSLHISQPTLSKQMMELEEKLGSRLFTRSRKQITLTEEGVFFQARAQEMLELMEKTEAVFREKGEPVCGDLYLGCGETPAFAFAADVFAALKQKHPSLNLHLYSGDADTVLERLEKGLLDMCLLHSPKKREKFQYQKLPIQDQLGLLMREEDPLARLSSISQERLKELPLILSERTWSGEYQAFWAGARRQDYQVAATYNLIYNATFLVRNGTGYAVSLEGLWNAPESGLTFRPIRPRQAIDIYLVTKKYPAFSPPPGFFYDALTETLGKGKERSQCTMKEKKKPA